MYLAEIDRLKADYARACTKVCTIAEERDMLRARLAAAEERLEQRREGVVGFLSAALRMSRAT